jgi:hypothetical protein
VITGSGFQNGATVDFGSRIVVQSVVYNSPEQLTVLIKIHRRASTGSRDVTVTNPDSSSEGFDVSSSVAGDSVAGSQAARFWMDPDATDSDQAAVVDHVPAAWAEQLLRFS